MVSRFFPAINIITHITKFTNFSVLPVQVQNRAGQARVTGKII